MKKCNKTHWLSLVSKTRARLALYVDFNWVLQVRLAPDVGPGGLTLQHHPIPEDFWQGDGALARPWAEYGQDSQQGGGELDGVHVDAAASDDERRLSATSCCRRL